MALTRPTLKDINTTSSEFADSVLVINAGSAGNRDIGLVFDRSRAGLPNVTFLWNETTKSFTTGYTTATGKETGNVATYITSNADINAGNITSGGNVNFSGPVTLTGDVTIPGNLTVLGVTTTVNSTAVAVNDKNITLANNASTLAEIDGAGFDIGATELVTLRYNTLANTLNSSVGINAAAFYGNGAYLTSLTAANITGTVANASYALQAAQANAANTATTATSATTATTATYVTGLTSANVTTALGYAPLNSNATALTAQYVTGNAQPNITSVGTLSSLTVSANATVGNLTTAGNITASYLFGNASQLVGLPALYTNTNVAAYLAAQSITPYSNANVASYLTTANVTTTGNVSAGNLITSGTVINSGINTGAITATSLTTSGTVVNSGITTTGTVTANAITANNDSVFYSNLTVAGSLTVSGTTALVNSTNTYYTDNLLELHTIANLGNLAFNDGKDIGLRIHYFKTQNDSAALYWRNSDGALVWAGNGATESGAGTVGGSLGAFVANTLAGTLTTSAQPNITSVGTLTGLTVAGNTTITGNLIVSNVTYLSQEIVSSTETIVGNLTANALYINTTGEFGGNVTASYLFGNASQLTGLPALYTNTNVAAYLAAQSITPYSNTNVASYLTTASINTTGNISANYVTGTLQTAAQPNVTSVGTLANLNVTGNVTIGGNLTVSSVTYLSQEIVTTTESIAGNIIANGLQINNNGTFSGNVSANYLFGNAANLTGLPALYTNTNVAAYLAAQSITPYSNTNVASYLTTNIAFTTTANVTAGNVIATHVGNSTGTTATYTGNVTAGNVIATQYGNSIGTTATYTGNVTANYFLGNGSALTGLPVQYSNTNVAAYLLTTNVTIGNITANNIVGTSPGVTLVSGYLQYSFSNAGQVTFPASLTTISLSSNTTIAANGNITTNSNVTANGNVTASYVFANIAFATGFPSGGYTTSTYTALPTGDYAVGETYPGQAGAITDAFGVALGGVFDSMEPIGSLQTVDLGAM